jgi:hypothetical protein
MAPERFMFLSNSSSMAVRRDFSKATLMLLSSGCVHESGSPGVHQPNFFRNSGAKKLFHA